MGKRETEITRAIRGVLNGLGVYHFKVLQGLGCHPGVSDIIGVVPPSIKREWAGKILAIEVKTPRGRLSDYQKRFLAMIKRDGGIAGVARSVDDLIDLLGVQDRFLS
jgi:hypothetical protein